MRIFDCNFSQGFYESRRQGERKGPEIGPMRGRGGSRLVAVGRFVEEFVQGRVVDFIAAGDMIVSPLVCFGLAAPPKLRRLLVMVQMKAVEAAILFRVFLDAYLQVRADG